MTEMEESNPIRCVKGSVIMGVSFLVGRLVQAGRQAKQGEEMEGSIMNYRNKLQ